VRRHGSQFPLWRVVRALGAHGQSRRSDRASIGLLTLLGVFSRRWGIVGATLSFLTAFVTLSFLITTPDAWVSALGDAQHGFPYLSGGGRLVLKDIMLLAGGLLIMADSARAFLEARPYAKLQTMTASKTSIAPTE
jgi:hypothetical protein